jgi:hypothetical protein
VGVCTGFVVIALDNYVEGFTSKTKGDVILSWEPALNLSMDSQHWTHFLPLLLPAQLARHVVLGERFSA